MSDQGIGRTRQKGVGWPSVGARTVTADDRTWWPSWSALVLSGVLQIRPDLTVAWSADFPMRFREWVEIGSRASERPGCLKAIVWQGARAHRCGESCSPCLRPAGRVRGQPTSGALQPDNGPGCRRQNQTISAADSFDRREGFWRHRFLVSGIGGLEIVIAQHRRALGRQRGKA